MKKRTFVGKLWRGLAKDAVSKIIPYAGEVIANKKEDNGESVGKVDKAQLIGQLIAASPAMAGIILIAILGAYAAGFIDKETVEFFLGLFGINTVS